MGVSLAGGVHAQQHPAKPVRLIVPYASGGGGDIMGRIIATKATERLGAQMIVENRGGGTIIGAEPAGGTPEQFGRRLKVEMAAWAKVFGKPKAKNSQ
jgi:hypothetical protein